MHDVFKRQNLNIFWGELLWPQAHAATHMPKHYSLLPSDVVIMYHKFTLDLLTLIC